MHRIVAASSFAVVAMLPAVAGAQTIITPNPTAEFEGYNAGQPTDSVTAVSVADPAVPFTTALRIKRGVTGANTFDAAVIWPTRAAVTKGDLLLATYWVRRTTPSSATLKVEMNFQLNEAPFTSSMVTNAPVDKAGWQRYGVPFYASEDFAAGIASLQVRYGLVPDEFEIGGITVENLGPLKTPFASSISRRFSFYYPGRGDANAPWRQRALANIEQTRKAQMTVRIVNRDGTPAVGASIDVRQLRTSFYWATVVEAARILCDPAKGPIRPCGVTQNDIPVTATDQANYRRAVRTRFNSVGFENNLKWPQWEDDRQLALDGFTWLAENGVPFVRGHNLIWPGYQPDFLLPLDVNAAASPAYTRRRVNEHFDNILGALKGKIPEWDVVNEPFNNNSIQGRIATPNVPAIAGKLPMQEIADWYLNARRLDPQAKLFVNDFGVLENSKPDKVAFNAALIRYIRANGGFVDGMGFQGHFAQSGPDFALMQSVIDVYEPLVERLSLTEYDSEALDEALQADITDDMMTFIFGSPKFTGFEMWGFWDADHWLGNAPIFRTNWSVKPAGRRWTTLVNSTWKTPRTTLTTDATGRAQMRAFKGDYRLFATINGKRCVYNNTLSENQTVTLTAC